MKMTNANCKGKKHFINVTFSHDYSIHTSFRILKKNDENTRRSQGQKWEHGWVWFLPGKPIILLGHCTTSAQKGRSFFFFFF